MTREEKIISALKISHEGDSLYELAYSFKDTSMGRQEILELFNSFRNKFKLEENEKNYNIILDTMDYISGHCSKDKKIF